MNKKSISKGVSAADRAQAAHDDRRETSLGDDNSGHPGWKILVMVTGVLSAAFGFFFFSQLTYLPPLAGGFLLQALCGVALVSAAWRSLAERKPLPHWSILLTFSLLLFTLLVGWLFLSAAGN